MNDANPRVSVIIPVFNRVDMLIRALASLDRQTYTNFEVQIVDDASKDDLTIALDKFPNLNLVYHRLGENSGACAARNYGLDRAKGDFVTFLDSDDEYLPEKISRQVRLFFVPGNENVIVVSCGRLDSRNGTIYRRSVPKNRGNIMPLLLRRKSVGAGTPFLMIRKKVLDEFKIRFDPAMMAAQDYDFLIRVAVHGNFDFVDEPLVMVHHHDEPRISSADRLLAAGELQYVKYRELLNQHPEYHDDFVFKLIAQNYAFGRTEHAKSLLQHRLKYSKRLRAQIWKYMLFCFPKYEGVLAKSGLKLLKLISGVD